MNLDHPSHTCLASLQPLATSSASTSSTTTTSFTMSRDESVLHTSIHEWRYLNEGKMNIVFSYCSNNRTDASASVSDCCSTSLLGQVIKVNKGMLRLAQTTNMARTQLAHRLLFAQRYVDQVMKRLFHARAVTTSSSITNLTTSTVASPSSSAPSSQHPSDEWFDIGRIVWIHSSILAGLIERAQSLRPIARIQQFSSFTPRTNEDTLLPVFLYEDYTSPLHLHLRSCATIAMSPTQLYRTPSQSPPTICFELKPKWGYLPRRTSTQDSAIFQHQVKYDTCRYCMYQYLKLKKGEVTSLSGFCPLDLFSCQPTRVHRALHHLFATPQNNFRIFVRGGSSVEDGTGGQVQMIDVHDIKQMERLVELLFPTQSSSTTPLTSSSAHLELFHSFLTSLICSPLGPFPDIFKQLSLLQQRLDYMDIEGLYPHIVRTMKECPDMITEDYLWKGIEPTADGPTPQPTWLAPLLDSFIHPFSINSMVSDASTKLQTGTKVFEFIPSAELTQNEKSSDATNQVPICAHCAHSQRSSSSTTIHTTPTPTTPLPSPSIAPCSSSATCPHWHQDHCQCFILQFVRAFLLATTLKDISIMCTMQAEPASGMTQTVASTTTTRPSSSSDSSHSSASAFRVNYSVRLIDLECKSIDKLPEYYRLDQEIVTHYLESTKLSHSILTMTM